MNPFRVKKVVSILFLATCISPFLYSDCIVDHDALFDKCRVVPQFHSYDFSSAQIEACRELVRSDRVDLEAHFYLGRLLYLNIMHEEAEQLFQEGYYTGSTKSALAYTLINGGYLPGIPGIAEDISRAIHQDASDRGDPVASVLLGNDFLVRDNTPTEQDKESAYELFLKGAQKGYPVANYFLARFYRNHCPVEDSVCLGKTIDNLKEAAAGGVRDAVELLEAHGEDIDRFGSLDDMLYQIPDPFSMIILRP